MVAEQAGAQMNLRLSVALLPSEDDEVLEEQGARVFLEPEAAALLDDKVLDATASRTGSRSRSRTMSRSSRRIAVARRGRCSTNRIDLSAPDQEEVRAPARTRLPHLEGQVGPSPSGYRNRAMSGFRSRRPPSRQSGGTS
jgi:hypothetical protein